MIFLKAYKKLMDIVAELEKIVTSVILVFVTCLTFANVCVRYLSDGQFAWSEELTINLFILLIMMGCGLCARSCPQKTIVMVKGKARIIASDCIKCYCCQELCTFKAVRIKKSIIYRLVE